MVPPAPGRMPMKMPISDERISVAHLRKMVLTACKCSILILAWFITIGFFAAFGSRMSESSWLKANSPTNTGRKAKPCLISSMPKVKRATPLVSSSPIEATSRPKTPAIRPLVMSLPARLAVMVSANTTSEK